MNSLPVYDDRYIKANIRICGAKGYTNFCGLNVPEKYLEYDFFTVTSIDFCTRLWKQILPTSTFRQLCL